MLPPRENTFYSENCLFNFVTQLTIHMMIQGNWGPELSPLSHCWIAGEQIFSSTKGRGWLLKMPSSAKSKSRLVGIFRLLLNDKVCEAVATSCIIRFYKLVAWMGFDITKVLTDLWNWVFQIEVEEDQSNRDIHRWKSNSSTFVTSSCLCVFIILV